MKGETFTVQIVATDQLKHTISNSIVHCSPKSAESGLDEGQLTQQTIGDNCTDLEFNVYSPHSTEQLQLYADGPCKDANMSLTLRVIDNNAYSRLSLMVELMACIPPPFTLALLLSIARVLLPQHFNSLW